MRFVIHPAIGIARVGNSEKYYLAPEEAGGLPLSGDGRPFQLSDFRDGQNKLCRQAVRFQVFDYQSGTGVPVEPGKGGVHSIRWTVHVANKKASWYEFLATAGENGYAPDHPLRNSSEKNREKLIIDPGPRTLEGPGQHTSFSRSCPPKFPYSMNFPNGPLNPPGLPIDSLGDMWTDEASRMIFAGGYGISGTSANPPVIPAGSFANNDGWWDDTSDGPVRAEVIMDDDTAEEALSAWVTVAPPRYAPQLVSLVTLYDVIYDIGVRFQGLNPDIFADGMWNTSFEPSWSDHIRPILGRAHQYQWVVAVPPKPHDFDWERLGEPNLAFNAYRKYYLDQVRAPDQTNRFASPTTGMPMMPYLCGDNCVAQNFTTANYLTLTRTQYFYLLQWAQGKFATKPAPKLSPGEQLDRSALENCSGGAFSPGIEMSWICRNPEIYASPFRIRLKNRQLGEPLTSGSDLRKGLEPGDLSKYQALPWQADFNECSVEPLNGRFVWWWPVQRPTFVHTEQEKQVAWIGTINNQNAGDYVQFADDLDMVNHWSELGFVCNRGTQREPYFVEMNRLLPR